MGPDGDAIRCLALISTYTQERTLSQAILNQIENGGTDKETARQQAMAHNSNSPLFKLPGGKGRTEASMVENILTLCV